MNNFELSKCNAGISPRTRRWLSAVIVLVLLFVTAGGPGRSGQLFLTEPVKANSTYASLSSGSFSYNLTAATANLITSNNNWSAVPSVEGYFGGGLTATHGVDPQTVLTTEFANHTLPNSPTNVAANKSNPNAFNAGGIAEFDSGTYIAIGFQGNVQANPYLVFYVSTLGRTGISISYQVTDIDGGSNNAVSPVALQYRVGSTGPFTNVPAGYIADATQGPNVSGLVTSRNVSLPLATFNQPVVQIRLITTNAADTNGSSTPDEWIGVNNVVVSSSGSTAAQVDVAGRLTDANGRGVPNALVDFIGPLGERSSGRSNPFGYYRIYGLNAGQTYVVVVNSKRYSFESQVVNVFNSIQDLDFVAATP